MGSYSIGEALSLLLERSAWKPKVQEIRMREEWGDMMGNTISKHTRNIALNGSILTIYTEVAALKQELLFSKEQLIARINEHFGEKVVTDIVVK